MIRGLSLIRLLQSFAALLIYAVVSVLFFGLPLRSRFSTHYIGAYTDPTIYMWSLVWWPHALAHRLNPLLTTDIWTPTGVNLTWTTTIPGASLLAYPITRSCGPIVSYNLLCLIAPALAAWTAFLLCVYLASSFWPSLIGGYIFGFSSYVLAEMHGHLFLVLIFPIPIAVYLVVRRYDGSIRPSWFVTFLALALIAQILFSTELFATMTLFGAMVIIVGRFLLPQDRIDTLYSTARSILISYAIAAAVLSPFLYYIFTHGYPHAPLNVPREFSTDMLNFLVPTPVTYWGSFGPLSAVARKFRGGFAEAGAYFGPVLAVIAYSFAISNWGESTVRITVISLVLIWLASLGEIVHVAGISITPTPWILVTHMPLIMHALPVRFMVYAFLDLAIICSLYLTNARIGRLAKAAIGLGVLASIWPNLADIPYSRVDTPRFFTEGTYKHYLMPGESVLLLPYASHGILANSMLWQAQTDMYFKMAGGYVAPAPPPEFLRWPVVRSLYAEIPGPDFAPQLKAFLAAHGVSTVLLADQTAGQWQQDLSTALNTEPIRAGGIRLYKIPAPELVPYQNATAIEMESRYNSAIFAALIVAADKYLSGGRPLEQLSLVRAQALGFLGNPCAPDEGKPGGPWLGPSPDGNGVAVALFARYSTLAGLIETFRANATAIYFPYPKKLLKPPKHDHIDTLFMVFSRDQISRLAKKLEAQYQTTSAISVSIRP